MKKHDIFFAPGSPELGKTWPGVEGLHLSAQMGRAPGVALCAYILLYEPSWSQEQCEHGGVGVTVCISFGNLGFFACGIKAALVLAILTPSA